MHTYHDRYCNSLQKIFLKTFTALVFLINVIPQQAFGQVTDNFSDGNFTTAPAWTGMDSKFVISTNRLKLQAPAVNDQAYLATASAAINDASWEFFVRLEFNPSSGNYARVYLTSDQSDLSGLLNGYFVGIGNASDEISLYRQTGSTITEIIDGLDNRLNISVVDAKVKVTRDALGNWSLYSDVGLSSTYSFEGTVADIVHPYSAFFGVYCFYSSTRSDKFYFDDFVVTGNPFVDTVPPEWQTLTVNSATQLKLSFSEELDESSAENIQHFEITGIGNPVAANLEADHKNVTLDFAEAFPNGIESQLVVTGLTDTSGNAMIAQSKSFLFFQPSPINYRDVVITEIFPDPSPKIGLPEAEFIELYNRSENPVQLQNWKITDGSSLGNLGSTILLPKHYVILCSSANEAQFSVLGKTIAVSNFPTLNNGTDGLKLKDNSDQYVDSVRYTDTWYKDDDKKQGGWTLEMIDPENTCKGEDNWIASEDPTGGTPGKINSVFSEIVDTDGPRFIKAIEATDHKVELQFDEKLDSQLPGLTDIVLSPAITIAQISFKDETLKSLLIELEQTIEAGRTYKINVSNIQDCPGNLISSEFAFAYLNLDTLAPKADTLRVVSQTSIEIDFNEKLNDADKLTNYVLAGAGNPSSVSIQNGDTSVRITFANPFPNGVAQKLYLRNFTDINGNIINDSIEFLFFQPAEVKPRDIIITEIFADPGPVVGLPEVEFVELYNRSENPIDLKNWKFTDGTSTAVLKFSIMLPHQYLILAPASAHSQFSGFGKTIPLANFPTLNNSGDAIVLKDPTGVNIDSVKFSSAWYHDDDKKEGGWSLELIDIEDVCKGSQNWRASLDTLVGGTPGKQNSVYAHMADIEGPEILSVAQLDSITAQITFNEKLESTLPEISKFIFEPPIPVSAVAFADESMTAINISFGQEIQKERMYAISMTDVFDCPGNKIRESESKVFLNLDTIPPTIEAISFLSQFSVEILFSEKILGEQAAEKSNYTLVNKSRHPLSASLSDDSKKITLTFSEPFENGIEEYLIVENLQDINDNKIVKKETVIMLFDPKPVFSNDVIITEIFPDPSPVIGLPEAEFVEVFNRSTNPIQLKKWTLTDGSSVATFPSQLILPGQYLIISSISSYNLLGSHGKNIGVPNFPTLNNDNDMLVLKNELGVVIDSVSYFDSWYGNEDKKAGGYSLELIDPENFCAEEQNWTASENEIGGTPGKQNSVFANKPDLTAPKLLSAIPISDTSLLLKFDEKLSKSIPPPSSFVIGNISIQSTRFVNGAFRELQVEVAPGFEKSKLYQISLQEVYDCAGNEVNKDFNTASFGLPELPARTDIVINEVLFNPRPTGVDFVEIYNCSSKFLNLKNFAISNIESDTLKNTRIISTVDFLFKPGDYLALTTEPNTLKGEYILGQEENFLAVSSLPSMNDDEGSVALTDSLQNVIDYFQYSDKMHSVFLKDDEGVSLERVELTQETNNSQNWKSASKQSGFATPGYVNSNTTQESIMDEEAILIEPEIFQPQSGQSDFAKISYRFDSGGFIANVKIFDPDGRPIKELANNEVLGPEGFFRWDGDEDNGSKASVGSYMVWFQVFNDKGVVQTFKKRIAVAGRF